MRQEIGQLVEEIYAQVFILDANMDVHARNQHAPHHQLQILGQHRVAFFVGVMLVLPQGKRMSRGGDRRQIVLGGVIDDGPAQPAEIVARLLD